MLWAWLCWSHSPRRSPRLWDSAWPSSAPRLRSGLVLKLCAGLGLKVKPTFHMFGPTSVSLPNAKNTVPFPKVAVGPCLCCVGAQGWCFVDCLLFSAQGLGAISAVVKFCCEPLPRTMGGLNNYQDYGPVFLASGIGQFKHTST